MAPEVLAEAVDPAPTQDMYALGVVLAELAIGGALWPGNSIEALLATGEHELAGEYLAEYETVRVDIELEPGIEEGRVAQPLWRGIQQADDPRSGSTDGLELLVGRH